MLDVGHIVCGLRGVIKLQDPLYFLGNLLVEIVCHAFLVIGRFCGELMISSAFLLLPDRCAG
ncbi:Uncharacterised protein [Neisseria gonorrhoeae]|uniref:Uncharacterized protein n=1 Tax=Neisseria gonorrhoeae TaxID=485 RepID=A0A378W0G7_NEIGO|nr:Uncharacterised protein [Neisseria gonorrhoeae]